MATYILVNIGSDDSLLPNGTKQKLPELMLTNWLIAREVLWHLPEGNFTGNAHNIYRLG